jgi:hypothetical protein
MKRLLYIIMIAALAATTVSSCERVEEEVEINTGNKTHIRVPDPEPMNAEDSAVVAAQQAEYEQNAK